LFREYSRCSGFIRKKDRGVTFSLSRFRPLEVTFSLSLDIDDARIRGEKEKTKILTLIGRVNDIF